MKNAYVKNETADIAEAQCLTSIRNDPKNIKFLSPEQRTEKVCLAVVSRTGDYICFLNDTQRSPKVCEAAAKNDGRSIFNLNDTQRTPQVLMEAKRHAMKNGNYEIVFLTDEQKRKLKIA